MLIHESKSKRTWLEAVAMLLLLVIVRMRSAHDLLIVACLEITACFKRVVSLWLFCLPDHYPELRNISPERSDEL